MFFIVLFLFFFGTNITQASNCSSLKNSPDVEYKNSLLQKKEDLRKLFDTWDMLNKKESGRENKYYWALTYWAESFKNNGKLPYPLSMKHVLLQNEHEFEAKMLLREAGLLIFDTIPQDIMALLKA